MFIEKSNFRPQSTGITTAVPHVHVPLSAHHRCPPPAAWREAREKKSADMFFPGTLVQLGAGSQTLLFVKRERVRFCPDGWFEA